MSAPGPARQRHAVRALLVTAEAELLLMRFVAPDRQVWITLGGGLLAGEEAVDGLHRELREETARTGWSVGPEVWRRRASFELDGATVVQHERYFLVPTARFEPPEEMPDEVERRWFGGFRWWPVEAIRRSSDVFAPRRLGECLQSLLSEGPPARPIDVGR